MALQLNSVEMLRDFRYSPHSQAKWQGITSPNAKAQLMRRIATLALQQFALATMLVLLIGQVGCGLSQPNWFQPGHLYHQRLRATHFDPYGDTDSAPEFDGIRPREYQRPRSETERAQWFQDVPAQPAPYAAPY